MPHRRAILLLSCTIFAVSALVSACTSDQIAAPPALTPGISSVSRGSDVNGPVFLTADPAAPSMANPVIAFWATKGVNREVRMYYHARPGHTDSTTFMWFRVRDMSLLQRPDGSPFATGDSVLITVTLVDPVALKLDFQPSGLRFSAHDSAEMKLSFKETLHDLNGDGVVDHRDADILRSFSIWRKESLTDPWLPTPSNVLSGSFEVQTKLGGFTGYAVAY